MDILEYFDNDFKSSIKIETIFKTTNRGVLVVLMHDLLRVSNEKVALEINWIL